jgi:hypothetical protein
MIAMNHLYHFFNDANIAISQSNNIYFKKYIDYIIENGNYFKNKNHELYFTRHKYKKQESITFSNFIHNVTNIINFCKTYYKKETNSNEMFFVNVSHDGWDSKDNDVLGVSIHFIIPEYWVVVNIAIGLERITSKKSKDVSDAVTRILNR